MGGSLKEGKATDDGAKFLGLVALVLLVAQNTAVVLLTKYTQLPDQKHYNSVVVVMLTELLKLVICCLLVSREPTGLWGAIRDQVRATANPSACAIPAAPGEVARRAPRRIDLDRRRVEDSPRGCCAAGSRLLSRIARRRSSVAARFAPSPPVDRVRSRRGFPLRAEIWKNLI